MRCETLARGAVASATLALLSGCGGSDGPGVCPSGQVGVPPNCMPMQCPAGQVGTPPNCMPAEVVVSQGTGYPLEAGFVGRVLFNTSQAGTMETTIDWTYPEDDVDFALVSGDCSFDQFMALQCPVQAFGISLDKPEVATTPSVPAGQYTLFVENIGPQDESISYQVVLTRSGTASTPPGASSRTREPQMLGRKRPIQGSVDF